MSDWGRTTYGDPCRECGYRWGVDTAASVALVAAVPDRAAVLLADARGDERHPDLAWPVRAYLLHVGDNLRIWAERLAGLALGDPPVVTSYDENVLATARDYEGIGLAAAQWSLGRATDEWLAAVQLSAPDVRMIHPERGAIDLADIAGSNAHDAVDHLWDIERSLAAS
jgi:hypothetical protein